MSRNPVVGRVRLAGRAVVSLTLVLTAALCIALPAEAAAGTLDQSQTADDAFVAVDDDNCVGQTFTPAITGRLDQVDLLVSRTSNVGDDLHVKIRTLSNGVPTGDFTDPIAGEIVSSQNVPLDVADWVSVPLTSGSAPSSAGTQYAIVLCAYHASPGAYVWRRGVGNPYPGGQAMGSTDVPFFAQWGADPDSDFAFKTYVVPDADGDGVTDAEDNCQAAPNADQADLDGDDVGDACDADDDGDGVPDAGDNCPTLANPDQVNSDGGQAGDACDADDDDDGVADAGDNCPTASNQNQADIDADGAGDACDGDDDGDGAADTGDNCPAAANGDQRNIDRDAAGDVCDPDDDNDRLSDVAEAALGTSPADLDSDDDGLADAREDRNHDGKKGRRETDAAKFDTDRDGLGDGLERGLRRGVKDPPGLVRGTGRRFRRDRDPRSKTNPLRRDTDHGGVTDGREDKNRNGRIDKGETDPNEPGRG
jgi:hypothetical protein